MNWAILETPCNSLSKKRGLLVINGNYFFSGHKQCCDSNSEPSQQGSSAERIAGWGYLLLIDTK